MSLETAYNPDNIFGKIIRGEMTCTKIFEDENLLAFMDVFPQSDGHCLIVHKNAPTTNLLDIEPAALAELTAGLQKLARAVRTGLSPDGVRVAQFNGAPAGQTVFHLHFHVIPVYEGESLGAHAEGGPADSDALEATAAKIRAAL
ncbi:MAG: HIT family protein [Pseudomonadota bacterium]